MPTRYDQRLHQVSAWLRPDAALYCSLRYYAARPKIYHPPLIILAGEYCLLTPWDWLLHPLPRKPLNLSPPKGSIDRRSDALSRYRAQVQQRRRVLQSMKKIEGGQSRCRATSWMATATPPRWAWQGLSYPHESEGHFTPQQYLPKRLLGTYFYLPHRKATNHK